MALPLATVVTCRKIGAITTESGDNEHILFEAVGGDELVVNGGPIKIVITQAAAQGLFTEGVNYSLTLDAIP